MKNKKNLLILAFFLVVFYFPNLSLATTTGTAITFENPLEVTTVAQLLTNFLTTLQGIIVTVAIIFIIIGAIMYITSAGNEKRITTAKGAIFAAMIGLAIAIAAPSFLREIYQILQPVGGTPAEVASVTPLSTIVLNVLRFLLSVVGVLALIMLVVGAIAYVTAAGDEKRIDTGKKIMTYSIIGIAIAMAAMTIVGQIANFFVAGN